MREILSRVRAAVDRYNMISEGDRIAVGISGGKDSLMLLCALAQLKRFYPKHFELCAIALDPCFFGKNTDYSDIQRLCDDLKVDLHIRRSQLYEIIFETRHESNPCSLCARMRRGILHDMCNELGCNKLALGHHIEDAAETFFMNLLNGGNAASFSPVTYLSRKDLYMIRPLIFVHENELARTAAKLALPVIKSSCPADGHTTREEIKQLLSDLSKKYDKLPEKIITALQKGEIGGW